MRRLLLSFLLVTLGASLTSQAGEKKDARKRAEPDPTVTQHQNVDKHPETSTKQKRKSWFAKRQKHLPTSSDVATKPETTKPDPFSKIPETKTLAPTSRTKPISK